MALPNDFIPPFVDPPRAPPRRPVVGAPITQQLGDVARGVSFMPYDLTGGMLDVINMGANALVPGQPFPTNTRDAMINWMADRGLAQRPTYRAEEGLGALLQPAAIAGATRVASMAPQIAQKAYQATAIGDKVPVVQYGRLPAGETTLRPNFGTGIRSQEAGRVAESPDLANRMSLYERGTGFRKEAGLPAEGYTSTARKVLRPGKTMERMKRRARDMVMAKSELEAAGRWAPSAPPGEVANQFEKLLQKRGYKGYAGANNTITYFDELPIKGKVRTAVPNPTPERIADYAMRNREGFSIDPLSGDVPETGVAIARRGGEQVIPQMTPEDILQRLQTNPPKPGDVLGGWTSEGQTYLDNTMVRPETRFNLGSKLLGNLNYQKALYNIGSGAEIPLALRPGLEAAARNLNTPSPMPGGMRAQRGAVGDLSRKAPVEEITAAPAPTQAPEQFPRTTMSVADLEGVPGNALRKSPEEMAEFTGKIQSGEIQPNIIIETQNGVPTNIQEGNHTLAAMRALGYENVPVRTIEKAALRKAGTRTTVQQPARKVMPNVYRDPRIIVGESATRVAPQSPMLQRLFGVDRATLDDMTRTIPERIPQSTVPIHEGTGRGAPYTRQVMGPANTQRLQDVLSLASQDPRFAGSYGWYNLEPLMQRYRSMFGDDLGMQKFAQFRQLGSALSPQSGVPQEIKRASLANYALSSGNPMAFYDVGQLPKGYGHLAHRSAHTPAVQRVEQTGLLFPPDYPLIQSPKVRHYDAAKSGQIGDPTADAHFARGIGLPDVRNLRSGNPDVGSLSQTEYFPIREWYKNRVAGPVGIPASPAQAIQWNAMGTSTGVDSPLSAPYLELLADAITKRAHKQGVTPETMRDLFIAGKEHL